MKEKLCIVCNNILKDSSFKYCSSNCQREYHFNIFMKNWENGTAKLTRGDYDVSNHIKFFLRKKYDNKCAICGWNEINKYTNNIPLEVEHLDGNYKNNDKENLTLLCPNCHSLTKTYKGANKGSGRLSRKRYYIKNNK